MSDKLDKDELNQQLEEGLLASTLPGAESIACRMALFGACGELWADNSFIKDQFKKSGDIGQQLLTKMNAMENDGWHFGQMSVQDPGPKGCIIPEKVTLKNKDLEFIVNHAIKRSTILSSNISNLLSTAGICNDIGRVVSYNNVSSIASSLTGSFASVSSPAKITAETVAHEISHHDGIAKLYSQRQVDKFTRQEAVDYAKRCIISEARAHLVQASFAESAKIKDDVATTIKQQAHKGTLGEWIHSQYKHQPAYPELKLLSGSDCNKAVNEHFEEHFGKNLFDPNNKLSIKDINAGVGKQIGSISLDTQLLAKMQNPALSELRSNHLLQSLEKLSHSPHSQLIGRSTQAIAGLGLVWTVSDLGYAFSEGPRSGAARMAGTATNWLGWELGGAIAALPARLIGKKVAMASFAGSLLGSMLSNEFIVRDLELAIKGPSHNA